MNTAIDLIATDIPALSVEQTGRDAFHLLNDFHIKHLPVVDGKRLVGILSEEDIFNHKISEPASAYDFSMIRRFAVQHDEHLMDIIKLMGEHRLTTIPVIDEQGNYLGMIAQNMLLRALSSITSFSEQGAVIVLEMDKRDYLPSQITHLIESERVLPIAMFISSAVDADLIEVTIKVNTEDITRVVSALERHEYAIKQTFMDDPLTDGMKDRYDALMHYLNM
jgi:acetoin utilization protein AcuB